MKNIIKFYLLTFLFVASPLFAVEGIAVINIQEAILKTQTANDAFKALDEDPDFSANMEQAQTLQADMLLNKLNFYLIGQRKVSKPYLQFWTSMPSWILQMMLHQS